MYDDDAHFDVKKRRHCYHQFNIIFCEVYVQHITLLLPLFSRSGGGGDARQNRIFFLYNNGKAEKESARVYNSKGFSLKYVQMCENPSKCYEKHTTQDFFQKQKKYHIIFVIWRSNIFTQRQWNEAKIVHFIVTPYRHLFLDVLWLLDCNVYVNICTHYVYVYWYQHPFIIAAANVAWTKRE